VAKVIFRMGLDAGYFRVYYDLTSDGERRSLAGTVFGFAAAAGTVLFVAVALGAPVIAPLLLGRSDAGGERLLLLATADIYAGTFAFVPLNLLRIEGRARTFALFIGLRNLLNTLLKVVFVVQGRGVAGVLWSDVVATAALSIGLLPVLKRGARPAFVPSQLRAALAFGLPKAPHGFMIQMLNLLDRKLLALYRPLSTVGIYDKSYALGAGVKFALSAFEPAWQPFVYGQIGKPDAARTLARVVTYAFGSFVALGLVVAVLGRELLMLLTFKNPAFWAGAPVVPIVALAYLLHGVFLLTSIGIGIEKKTRYYPLVTAAAAGSNLGFNLLLIPRFGMLGAAWATVLSYAVMAGLGYALSQRVYPIPFERGRLARVALTALATYALPALAPAALLPGLAVKAVALAAFPILLLVSGFLRPDERAWLRQRLH